ncbi:MAG: cytochrome c biogenesis protein ResB [Opitutaceae bacterium]|nr:cytochrome c biogenesis protein ResB [Opitutaceae bacterium]
MNGPLRTARDFLVSLKLTVVLLALGLILVFAATLDQVNLGIWGIQEKWFRTFVVVQPMGAGGTSVPIFPGGYAIGGLLLLNLIASHFYRFAFTWRKAGIQFTHLGVILLLIGELLSGLWQEDYRMQLHEGETKNFSEHHLNNELAIIDTTNPAHDEVVAIPEEIIARKEAIQHAKLPFRIVIKEYFPNSDLAMRDAGSTRPPQATMGIGMSVAATSQPLTYKQNERNMPAASVELVGTSGSIGTWLVSTSFSPHSRAPFLQAPQAFTHEGRTYRIALRWTRSYKPFSFQLLKVTHDVYPGTDTPKNFSSRLLLKTPDGREDREVLIYMNNPLRYGGYTFYQHQMDSAQGMTGLQAVKNPSWLLPYVACTMMTFGLLWQFMIHLAGFIERRRAAAAANP